jgi:hypothetical protein
MLKLEKFGIKLLLLLNFCCVLEAWSWPDALYWIFFNQDPDSGFNIVMWNGHHGLGHASRTQLSQ